MHRKKNSLRFLSLGLAAAIMFALPGCSSDSDKKGEEGEGNALPKILSFTYTSVSPQLSEMRGNNRFTYDGEGRVVRHVTDATDQRFTYPGDQTCSGVITWLADNSVMQEQTFRLDENGMPVEENVNYRDKNFKGTIRYKYDEKCRVLGVAAETDAGHMMECVHSYDPSTGMISEVSVSQKYPAEEQTEFVYRIEYSDLDTPVAFYPENLQWFDFEASFALTGQTGYRRAKLPDKIWVLTPEGTKTDVYLFKYDFSAAGKLTAVHLLHAAVDGNGTVGEETPYVDCTEITY